jgi:type IV fimbrial biogenesis protein FimT
MTTRSRTRIYRGPGCGDLVRGAIAGGFTLIELLVSMAVMAILLTLAVPAFSEVMVSSRLTALANTFLSNLYLARSEAIKRNSRAVLCKSSDGLACSDSGGWHQGWILFHDANNNAVLDADEAVILTQSALPPGFMLTGNTHVAEYISYSATGAAKLTSGAFQAGTLTLCSDSSSSANARHIVISSTGRPRIQKLSVSSCP